MKQWRREAAKVKALAIKNGTHEKGNRYGKMLRDTRRGTQVQGGLVSPLLAALLDRFARSWMADMLRRMKAS